MRLTPDEPSKGDSHVGQSGRPTDGVARCHSCTTAWDELRLRIDGLERSLGAILDQLQVQEQRKDWYSTTEVAEILDRRPYTVREWCRLGRVHAEKAMSGRGVDEEWRISRQELVRIQNTGLLPRQRATERYR